MAINYEVRFSNHPEDAKQYGTERLRKEFLVETIMVSGEINMAPITTAVEFAFSPIDATKIEQTKIHAVAPLNGISFLMASIYSISSLAGLVSSKRRLNLPP